MYFIQQNSAQHYLSEYKLTVQISHQRQKLFRKRKTLTRFIFTQE